MQSHRFTTVEVASLAVRLVIWGIVALNGHWVAGDSLGFMGHSIRFCSGDFFSGEPTKSPFYTLFVCVASLPTKPFLGNLTWMGGGFAAALLVQTLLIWYAGVFCRRKILSGTPESTIWQIAYHFEPGLLVYSSLLMSDGIFAALVLVASFYCFKIFLNEDRSAKIYLLAGLIFGLIALQRSLGVIWVAWTFIAILATSLFSKERSFRKPGILLLALLTTLAPRLVYQAVYHGTLSLAPQGGTWLPSVAAAVEGESAGISFKEAEDKWNKENPNAGLADVLSTFMEHPGSFLKLTAKGVARTVVGHVNIEWGLIASGKTLFGPAWFKKQEPFTGEKGNAIYLSQYGLMGKVLWVFGLLSVLCWTLWIYYKSARKITLTRRKLGTLSLGWLAGVIVLLGSAPLIFGDARFRLGYLPTLLIVWAFALRASRGEKIV